MDERIAKVLLHSFLERVEVDARKDNPLFGAVMSSSEREALRFLLGVAPVNPASRVLPVGPAPHAQTARASQVEPVHRVAIPDMMVDAAVPGPRPVGVHLDETALSGIESQHESYVLALDFGTAKSKAFAASVEDDEDSQPELIELGLGRRDGDIDGSVYTVSSSIWASEEGLMFVGSEALRRSMGSYAVGTHRRRLDSIKQQLTLTSGEQNLSSRRLEPEVNRTKIDLTYEDAICFFLAYLTDLAVTELSDKGQSRYIKRRFTIPSWQPTQRAWAAASLSSYVVRAQLLADTFHGRWKEGVSAEQVKSAVAAAAAHDKELGYLLDKPGLLEPLAAGSGRIWADRTAKNLVLVLDVGAGTTDFSLFWVVQNVEKPGRRAFPVQPCSDAIRMAGDILDDILLHELLSRAHGSLTSSMRGNIEIDLRLRGLRRLKEQLFRMNKLEVPLVTDQAVSLELEEFINLDRVKTVGKEIEMAIGRFLQNVHESWSNAPGDTLLVLTGGGADLPMVKEFAKRTWNVGGRQTVFNATAQVPDLISQTFDLDFQREYQQLAVAIGAALPVLDEKTSMREWMGSMVSPGPLDRFQVTGV